MIMMSSYAETDFAEMIDASPAIGFLAKTSLSAGAIRALAGHRADRSASNGHVPHFRGD
jgi:hypothetical protein